MAKRNKLLLPIAGIFMLTAGVFNILWLAGVFTRILDVKELLRGTSVISPFPYIILDIGFGGNSFIASLLAIVFILGILLSIIGGLFAVRRKTWGLALTGAAGAFVCIPILGIVAIIIILISWSRFTREEKS
jgi:hypothetical protein